MECERGARLVYGRTAYENRVCVGFKRLPLETKVLLKIRLVVVAGAMNVIRPRVGCSDASNLK